MFSAQPRRFDARNGRKVCRCSQQKSRCTVLNCLNAGTACATVDLVDKFGAAGGNYFWSGIHSCCQPAHASRANERGGKSHPRSSLTSIRPFLGNHFSKMVSARRHRSKNDAFSGPVSRRERTSEPTKFSRERGQDATDRGLRRGLRRTLRSTGRRESVGRKTEESRRGRR